MATNDNKGIKFSNISAFKEESDKVYIANDKAQNLSDAAKVQAQNNMMGKTYSSVAADHSGLGKVYLSKNNGVLTQSMLPVATGSNTIYVIQYTYDLNNATIDIPANSILLFDGGSIANGTVRCDNTAINAPATVIFDNLVLQGTLSEDLTLNHFKQCNKCTQSAYNTHRSIHVIGSCTIDEPLNVKSGFNMYGDNMYFSKLSLSTSYTGQEKTIFHIDDVNSVNYITIRDISIIGQDYGIYKNGSLTSGNLQIANFQNIYFDTVLHPIKIYGYGVGCVIMDNLEFTGNDSNVGNDFGPAIDIKANWYNRNSIQNSRFSGVYDGAISIKTVNNGNRLSEANNNFINNCWFELIKTKVGSSIINLESEQLYGFYISDSYWERLEDVQGTLVGLCKITTPTGRINRTIGFSSNSIMNAFPFVLKFDGEGDAVDNIVYEKNTPHVYDHNIIFSVPCFTLCCINNVKTPTITGTVQNLIKEIPGGNSVVTSDKFNFLLQSNTTRDVIITNYNTSAYVIDLYITYSSGAANAGIVRGVLVWNGTNYIYIETFNSNDGVVVTKSGQANLPIITIENTGSMREFRVVAKS